MVEGVGAEQVSRPPAGAEVEIRADPDLSESVGGPRLVDLGDETLLEAGGACDRWRGRAQHNDGNEYDNY